MKRIPKAVIKVIDYTLDTDTTPLGYLVVLHSFVFGVSVASGFSSAAFEIVQYGALIGPLGWGMLLVTGTVILLLGMSTKHESEVLIGGFMAAMAWIFAFIVYMMAGLWIHMALAGIVVMEFGYFIFAVTLNRLWNYTPDA